MLSRGTNLATPLRMINSIRCSYLVGSFAPVPVLRRSRSIVQTSKQTPNQKRFCTAIPDSSKMDASYGLLPIQNMVQLVKALKLPVAFRVNEVKQNESAGPHNVRDFVIIVHVLGDHAFKRYLSQCSRSDLMLFRGLLLKVRKMPSMTK